MAPSGDLVGSLAGLLASKSKGSQNKILFKVFESLVCSICQEYMYVPMMIQCGHNFCYSCLSAWFNSNSEEELSCPHCRGSVVNMPCVNSTLQQWLRSVIDLLDSETVNEVERSTLARISAAKRSSEDEYREHIKDHELFKGVFKNSAVGVQDEDDDGILRCSNCHWELEDDDDASCPHCNMRIRSRPRRAGSQSENEEPDTPLSEDEEIFLSEEEARTADTELCLLYAKHDYTYATRLDHFLKDSSDTSTILEGQSNPDFLVSFQTVRTSSAVFHYPSYSLYASIVLDAPDDDKKRVLQIIREAENYGPDNLLADFDDFVAEQFETFRHMTSGSPLTKEQFENELRQYASSASLYGNLIHHEIIHSADDRPLRVLSFDSPFIAQVRTDSGDRIVFPTFCTFIAIDQSPALKDERRMVLSYARRMEEFCRYGHYTFNEFQRRILENGTERSEEDDDSLRDFIASDDDDDDVDMAEAGRSRNVIDLEAEQSDHSSLQPSDPSRDGSGESSNSEEPDSDYYERNEGDGYVSGDSLNDDDRTGRTRSEDEQDKDEDDEDDDDEPSRVRIRRKRNRAIVEASDDDDSSDD